ncbi:helix-turn-helix transcriptional regulator [Amycolatopsis acidicola]|uniref:Helix-turn-helix transcriptional regulator n=1 Tax=Amycolatopsis acidicola TaxID=2596893 RepID=A0A5N0V3M7_9PSEU|nr:winged helix-turn-helix transcriptional regulator [Amycolatopsis acidicola]KAA9159424.1 helix-turn-helix transcriptional regulator [Amycolatopsis acidicola]
MEDAWDMPYRQAALEVMRIFKREWTLAVLATLALGEVRHKDLLAEINAVEERIGWSSHEKPLSARVLNYTLEGAVENGLIERRAESGNFGAVWYQLTPVGRSLLRATRPLAEWAQQNRQELRNHRPSNDD